NRRKAGARAYARNGEPTPAFNSLAGNGTESSSTGQRCLRAKIESPFDQPNQKADRATRFAHQRAHRPITPTLGQSSQTDLDQRSRCAHGSITPGAVAGIRRTQSS